MSATEEKKSGCCDGDIGKGCHRADRKVPFMPKTGGRELWAAGPCGFMALNSAASLWLLKRRQQ